jgi:hypothetical protein
MTIDEYVYTPGGKKSNCALRFVRGVFRVITGQITKLNPERFRVKTRMATIGIRGCDLGFTVTELAEDVYVIAFHEAGESVVVYARPNVGEGEWQLLMEGRFEDADLSRTHLRNVTRSNRVVTITSGGVEERTVTSEQVEALLGSLGSAGAAGAAGGTAPGEGQTPADGSATQPGTWDEGTDGDAAGAAGETGDTGAAGTTEGEAGSSASQPNAPEPEPLEIPTPPPNTGPESVYTRKGGGTGWEWGIWTTDGSLDRVAFTASSALSASDYQAILRNATLYRLTGTGASAAAISSGNGRSLVEGSCNLNVRIGNSITPSWDGAFSMNNTSGDSLAFDASGTIQADGSLTGNQTAYQMSVSGRTFYRNSITAESVTGNLLRSSGATRPTGAAGRFHFEHGGSATVDGGFGVNF